MPFNRSHFAPIGNQARAGAAPQWWAYRTQDTAAQVAAAGYFNPVAPLLRPGDVIHRLTVDNGGTPVAAGLHVVLTVSNGAVDVSNETALTLANT